MSGDDSKGAELVSLQRWRTRRLTNAPTPSGERRQATSKDLEDKPLKCPVCENEWFDAPIALSTQMLLSGLGFPIQCRQCGTKLDSSLKPVPVEHPLPQHTIHDHQGEIPT